MASQTSSLNASDLRRLRSMMRQYQAVGKTLPPTLIRDYMEGQASAAQATGERSAVRSLEQQRLSQSKNLEDRRLALQREQMEKSDEAARMSGLMNLGVLGMAAEGQWGTFSKGYDYIKGKVGGETAAEVATTPPTQTGGGAASIQALTPHIPMESIGQTVGTAGAYAPTATSGGIGQTIGTAGEFVGGVQADLGMTAAVGSDALATTTALPTTTGSAATGTTATTFGSSLLPVLGPAGVGFGVGKIAQGAMGTKSGGAITGMGAGMGIAAMAGMGPVGIAVAGIAGLLGGGSWLCTEYDNHIGLETHEMQLLVVFRKYCNSKHHAAFQYYLEHGEELINTIDAKVDDVLEFYRDFGENVLKPVFKYLEADNIENAYTHYSESTLAFMEKFTPHLAGGLAEAMDEREVA